MLELLFTDRDLKSRSESDDSGVESEKWTNKVGKRADWEKVSVGREELLSDVMQDHYSLCRS